MDVEQEGYVPVVEEDYEILEYWAEMRQPTVH